MDTTEHTLTAAPLQDVTVIEAAQGVAGPFCGRMLAAFGANVIKVEPPEGDRTRRADPRLPSVEDAEASALYLYLNMGKRGVALDRRSADGAAAFSRLLEGADVLIGDERAVDSPLPDGMIRASLSPFGSTGPYARWRSSPLVSLALGGFLYLSGDEDREPLMIPGYQSECLAGLHAYSGVLMALCDRDRTGAGRAVEVSEIETLAALHQFTTVMHTYGGLVRRRHGARWENQGGYGRYPITVLPCKDGYVSYAVSTEGQWELLFPMIGRPELLDEPRFATFVERRERADEIDAILIDWMKDKTRHEIFQLAAGSWSEPAAPLLELDEVLADPQLAHRGFFAEIDHPDAGTLTYPTAPFKMSLTPPTFKRAPKLGEHTGEITAPSTAVGRAQASSPAPNVIPANAGIQSAHPQPGDVPASIAPSTPAPNVIPSNAGIQSACPEPGAGSSTIPPTAPPCETTSGNQTPLSLDTLDSGVRRNDGQTLGILSDVRILDLTRVWAGPLATRILADFGAEVIKISDPRAPLDRVNGTNNKLNRNKSSVALRLDHDEGRRMFLELVAVSDVVVENFRPRVMRNFELTYERLREVRPDVIMCSMPGFGTTGDYADYPAFGPSVEAMTGLPSMMGYEGGPPRTSSLAYPDPIAGLNAVAAMMTALRHRRRTGQGQFIDVALTEGPICQIGERIVAHSRTGERPPRAGNSHPDHAPYGVYPAAGDDEWIAVCVTSDAEWRALCELMDAPALASDPGCRAAPGRVARRAELDAIVAEWSRVRDAGTAASALQARGVAAGRVANNRQLLDDAHLNARGFFAEIAEPDVGVKKYPGQPIRMDGAPPAMPPAMPQWKPSARLGEHSRQVMTELLGMTPQRANCLERAETVGAFTEDD